MGGVWTAMSVVIIDCFSGWWVGSDVMEAIGMAVSKAAMV